MTRPQTGKVARFICDVYTPAGEPFDGDPRGILKKQMEEAKKLGYEFNVGNECEFFLFQTDENGRPTTKTNDEAGYFDLDPIDMGTDARRDICLTLEQMGFEIEASHHEVAEGQHEIDFKYADALTTADNVVTFRLAVKTIAKKYGLHATFIPKPIFGINGSGMHTNMSLFKDGYFSAMAGKRRSFFKTLFWSFCLTLCVELMQLITKVGCFDVDDILLNTIGGVLGYIVFVVCNLLRRRNDRKKRKEKR